MALWILTLLLRKEQFGFRRTRRCINQCSTLRLIIKKCLSHQTHLVFSFIHYEQAFDSVDRTAISKVLSLYGVQDKYIRLISAICENNIAAVKVGNEVSSWFRIESGVKQGCVLSQYIYG